MTSAFSSRGRRARACAALGAVALSAVALAACEKPTPMAQITVGSETASTEAACYEDGETISDTELRECVEEEAQTSITMRAGDKLRIGVEPEIAENGWVLFLNGSPAIPEPNKNTYVSFNGDSFFATQNENGQPTRTDSATIGIVEVDEDGDYKGAWNFDIEREDS